MKRNARLSEKLMNWKSCRLNVCHVISPAFLSRFGREGFGTMKLFIASISSYCCAIYSFLIKIAPRRLCRLKDRSLGGGDDDGVSSIAG
jgi:hypothetical protein